MPAGKSAKNLSPHSTDCLPPFHLHMHTSDGHVHTSLIAMVRTMTTATKHKRFIFTSFISVQSDKQMVAFFPLVEFLLLLLLWRHIHKEMFVYRWLHINAHRNRINARLNVSLCANNLFKYPPYRRDTIKKLFRSIFSLFICLHVALFPRFSLLSPIDYLVLVICFVGLFFPSVSSILVVYFAVCDLSKFETSISNGKLRNCCRFFFFLRLYHFSHRQLPLFQFLVPSCLCNVLLRRLPHSNSTDNLSIHIEWHTKNCSHISHRYSFVDRFFSPSFSVAHSPTLLLVNRTFNY